MGLCFASGLLTQGARVIAVDIKDGVQQDSNNIPGRTATDGTIEYKVADVSSQNQVQRLASEVAEKYGAIDVWVNNAGLFPQSNISSVSDEQLHRTFGVNVDGVFFGAQAASEFMKPGSSIVNMASVAASRVRPGRAIYSATKAAVKNLTNSLAVEFGHLGIRVNALAPGFINTEMTNWVHETPGAMEKALSSIPLGRIGEPDEVLKAMLFLISNSASYVTGHTLSVDGGSLHG
ncbi:hypothetical protein CIK64_15365 [Brevibacterium aurantiacum]|uniref:Uncharacterized protein n=2 Tax=Brevibacterium aurantiacum TaxID=273384 RepID=A0A2A3Z0C8_BREAU|nr:hypothetical protein CIK64_15365 [Brevibacterium aurantiacum]